MPHPIPTYLGQGGGSRGELSTDQWLFPTSGFSNGLPPHCPRWVGWRQDDHPKTGLALETMTHILLTFYSNHCNGLKIEVLCPSSDIL